MKRILLLLPLISIGCTEDSSTPAEPSQQPEPAEQRARMPPQVRLLDVLDRAELDVSLPPSKILDEVERETAIELEFEAPPTGWRRSRQWRIAPTAGATGKALSVTAARGRPNAILARVEPGQLVRVTRRRKGPAEAPELKVLELRTQPKDPRPGHPNDVSRVVNGVPVAGTYVSLAALIRRHPFNPEGGTSWESGEIELRTGPTTHSLLLLFDSGSARGRAWFDDVRVEILKPDHEQRLLMGLDRRGLDPQQPAGYAQFLPLPREDDAVAQEDHYEYRHGLVLPSPARVNWKLTLSEPMTLSFEAALLEESAEGASGRYSVSVNGDSVAQGPVGREWTPVQVNLEGLGEVELGLAIEGEKAVAVFANPILWRERLPEDPPEVFVFAVDTLRADRLATFGHDQPTSPALDALAKDAVVFERTTAQSNWTPESFAGLFTSRYAGQHGVTERFSVLEENTMAATLRNAGYFAQGIAYKLLLYDMGFERGFDAYFNRPRFHLDREYEVHAGTVWERAKAWLEAHRDRQSFLFVHFNDPHQPFNHRGESLDRFSPEPTRLGLEMPILVKGKSVLHGPPGTRCGPCSPGGAFSPEFVALARTMYDGEVHYTDRYLGLFIEQLKAQGRYDDALIVFVSDHGELLGEHRGVIGHGVNRMFEEVLHVPLVIKPPKSSGIAARRVDTPVRLLDLLPTVLELVNLEAPESLEGRSLVPLMKGAALPDERVVSENVGSKVVVAHDGRHKLTLNLEDGRTRWVNLEADPRERSPRTAAPEGADALLAHAIRHVVRTHPGEFLLVESEEKLPTLGLSCGAPATLRPIVGRVIGKGKRARLTTDERSRVRFAAVLEELPDDCELKLGDQKQTLGEAHPWESDGTTVELGPARVRRIRGEAASREVKESISARELEALEALGYMGH